MIKSQILAGGRGLGKFTNGLQARGSGGGPATGCWGWASALVWPSPPPACMPSNPCALPSCLPTLSRLQGGVHICKATEAPALAEKMLGGTLVTKQARRGAAGRHAAGRARLRLRLRLPPDACQSAGSAALPPSAARLSPAPPNPNRFPLPQTGARGKPVNTLYVANKMKLKREMYFALLLDRSTAGPVMIGCSEVGGWGRAAGHRAAPLPGAASRRPHPLPASTPTRGPRALPLRAAQGGTSIEELAEKFPDKIVKIPIDIRTGITDAQAMQVGAAWVRGSARRRLSLSRAVAPALPPRRPCPPHRPGSLPRRAPRPKP